MNKEVKKIEYRLEHIIPKTAGGEEKWIIYSDVGIISLSEQLFEIFTKIEQERNGLKAYISGLESEVGEQIAHRILDNPEQELQELKSEVRKYIYEKEDNYPKLKKLIE